MLGGDGPDQSVSINFGTLAPLGFFGFHCVFGVFETVSHYVACLIRTPCAEQTDLRDQPAVASLWGLKV